MAEFAIEHVSFNISVMEQGLLGPYEYKWILKTGMERNFDANLNPEACLRAEDTMSSDPWNYF